MKQSRRIMMVSLLLALWVLFFNGMCHQEPPPPNYATGTIESTAPSTIPTCQTSTSDSQGPFRVVPMAQSVCLQQSPQGSWQKIEGEFKAKWENGLGTFLNGEAIVYLPDDPKSEIFMGVNTELHLPNEANGILTLNYGKITFQWNKAVKSIKNIISGGKSVDPEFAILELTHDPQSGQTEMSVYAGEVFVTSLDTGNTYSIPIWDRVRLTSTGADVLEPIDRAPPVIEEWLQELELPLEPVDIPRALDPLFINPVRQPWFSQVMVGLYWRDVEDNIHPGDAVELETLANGREHIVYLREGASWSDGVPLTAHDYRNSICRAGDPDLDTSQLADLDYIDGFQPFRLGETRDCNRVGVEVIDDFTLKITLVEPLSDLPRLLAETPFYPVREDLVERYLDQWVELENFVGNGPYQIRAWQPGDALVLERNPNFWNQDAIQHDMIQLPILDGE